jgi:hypothetical protein
VQKQRKPIVVFSRARTSSKSSRSLEEVLIEEINSRWGLQVLSVSELYDLRPHGRTISRLKEISSPLIVLHRFSEKATYWLLQKLGIPGSLYSLSEEGGYTDPDNPRPIACLSTDSSSEQAILSQLTSVLGDPNFCPPELLVAGGGDGESSEEEKYQVVQEPTTRRWYPVIDRSRCEACLECLNFCLFGVYSLDEQDMPLVDQPDACRLGCPACSRICPTGAILFPEHDDPMISGRREWIPPSDGAGSEQSSGEASQQRMAAESERYSAFEREPKVPPSKSADAQDDDLDDLIDRIDEMEL